MGICSQRHKPPGTKVLERGSGYYDVFSRERTGSVHPDPESSDAAKDPKEKEEKSKSTLSREGHAPSHASGTQEAKRNSKAWHFSIGWVQHKYYELRGTLSRDTRSDEDATPTRDRQGASQRQRVLVRSTSAPAKQELPRVP